MIKKGFTLVELLVVISIIGILAALSIVSFTTSQRQARDSQRKSDLRQYFTALEGYANKTNGLYVAETDASGAGASTTLCTRLGITTCPEDPRNSADPTFSYQYQSNGTDGASDATIYVLWGKLENSSDYWVVCSGGKVGAKAQSGWSNPSGGACPI